MVIRGEMTCARVAGVGGGTVKLVKCDGLWGFLVC